MMQYFADWPWTPKPGYKMISKVESSFQVDRHIICLISCTLSPVCDSYNYRPSDQTCQLNTHDTQHTLETRVSTLLPVDLPFRQDLSTQHTRHSTHSRDSCVHAAASGLVLLTRRVNSTHTTLNTL